MFLYMNKYTKKVIDATQEGKGPQVHQSNVETEPAREDRGGAGTMLQASQRLG